MDTVKKKENREEGLTERPGGENDCDVVGAETEPVAERRERSRKAGGTGEGGANLAEDLVKRENFDHGFAEEDWEAAKAEAGQAMIAAAARRSVIAYSDLVAEIATLSLEPQSPQLAQMLGEISTAEHEAGRGMLTVVVVHKHRDQMPGPGFFELARTLGHETRDREAFWIGELNKVYRASGRGE